MVEVGDEMEDTRTKIDALIVAMVRLAAVRSFEPGQLRSAYRATHGKHPPKDLEIDASSNRLWEAMFGIPTNVRKYLRRGSPDTDLYPIQPRHIHAIKRSLKHLSVCTDAPEISDDLATWRPFFDYVLARVTQTPPLVYLPVSEPTHFTGREAILAQIEGLLCADPQRVSITAIHGLRGVGKTAVAAAFADRHKQRFHAVVWIDAQSEASRRKGISLLGARLGWFEGERPESEAISITIEKLREVPTSILLIFDDAPDMESIRAYLPARGGARVLITSNSPMWGEVAITIELEVWSPDMGSAYLHARAGRADDASGAIGLSEALGGLPLAHAQAAAYCQTTGVSFSEYLHRFEAKKLAFLSDEKFAPLSYRGGLSVAGTFTLAIEEATKKLHGAAAGFMAHLSMVGPEPVPLFLFEKSHENFPDPLGHALGKGELDSIITALRALALVSRELVPKTADDGPIETIAMHRLVHELSKTCVQEDRLVPTWYAMFGAVETAFPADAENPAFRLRCELLIPHVHALWNTPSQVYASQAEWALLLNVVGDFLRARASYEEAKRILLLAFEMAKEAWGIFHQGTARICVSLALFQRDVGDLPTAIDLMSKAHGVFESTLGSEHPQVAEAIEGVGSMLGMQGDLTEAIKLTERALAIKQKALGEEHTSVAQTLSNLGLLLKQAGDLGGAMAIYKQALTILETNNAAETVPAAACLGNIGSLYYAGGNPSLAAAFLERALSIEETTYGDRHPHLLPTLNNLGLALIDLHRHHEAMLRLARAMAIAKQWFGEKDFRTAQAFENFAALMYAMGKSDWRITM